MTRMHEILILLKVASGPNALIMVRGGRVYIGSAGGQFNDQLDSIYLFIIALLV